MTTISLKPNERMDDLVKSGRQIIQNAEEFCFSLDAVLLAHFPKYKAHCRVLDLGTGTGVMPLLIADEADRVEAVEIDAAMADMAARSVALNGLTEKILVRQGDYREIERLYAPESFDLVLSNPPYRPVAHGQVNARAGVARARHEFTATLAQTVRAARYALRFHGRLAMVHLPERLGEIFAELAANQLTVKRLQFVQARADREPNMLLLEAVVGGAPGGLKVLPPLLVYDAAGAYTPQVLSYYQ